MSRDNFQFSRRRDSADIAIIGGGVIGLSIARELARRGVSDIVVFDKGELGKEASWAAGGILAPQVEADAADDFFKLASASRDLYPGFAQALKDETGIDVELDQTGTLYVAFNEDEQVELRRRLEWQRQAGLQVEWLDSPDLRRLEPNISTEARYALRFPDDWQVENRKLVEALIAANEKLGVTLLSNCEVTSLRDGGGRMTGVETANGPIHAPIVVVCAGAWTSSLRTSTSGPLEIEPVRGQMLCFKPAQRIAHHVIYSKLGYVIPRRNGRVLAGSTSEHVGFDKRVTDEGVSSIKSIAFEIAPALDGAPLVDSWAGFRPRAIDDLPLLGPDAGVQGLFYATGHYRNGILLAPITAHVIADLVHGVSSSFIEVFSPNRFCATHA
jgi:glycine oxidase